MKLLVKAVSDELIKQIKSEVKAAGIKASFRKHRESYAHGGIAIQPVKANKYEFNHQEVKAIAEILVRHNIDDNRGQSVRNLTDDLTHMYRRGFQFINVIEVL